MMASWYSVADNGGTVTASGIPFSDIQPTCAHKTEKFGTILKVTNIRNGKTTNCVVTDRGPYIKGRVIDLSPVGADDLGIRSSGVAPVRIAKVPLPVADPFEVGQEALPPVDGRPHLPPVVEKQPKPRRSKVSQGRGKSRSQGLRSRPKTKPLDAWQETRRNLRST
jgi:rare lipoprotein A (peptidoglycan hydrolase)